MGGGWLFKLVFYELHTTSYDCCLGENDFEFFFTYPRKDIKAITQIVE
jgi:hypothetical protein